MSLSRLPFKEWEHLEKGGKKTSETPVHECPWTSPWNTSSTCGILEKTCSETEGYQTRISCHRLFFTEPGKIKVGKNAFGVMVTPDDCPGNSQVHDVPRQKPTPPHLAVISDDCRDCPGGSRRITKSGMLTWKRRHPDRNVQGAVLRSSGQHFGIFLLNGSGWTSQSEA